jgi:hypothetical protein
MARRYAIAHSFNGGRQAMTSPKQRCAWPKAVRDKLHQQTSLQARYFLPLPLKRYFLFGIPAIACGLQPRIV